jgi:hypothetical protein
MIAIPDDKTRKQFYIPIYEEFCDQDWDTDDECLTMDNVFDASYHEKWGEDTDYDDEEDE